MALGFVAVAVFAGSLPATRLAVASLDANFVTAARAAIAGLIALPVLVVGRRPPPWRDLPKLGLCALCLVAGFPAFTAVALRSLPAAHGGVVLGRCRSPPPLLPRWSIATGPRRPSGSAPASARRWSSASRSVAAAASLRAGDALLLGAVACAACGYTWSAQLSRRLSPPEVISWIVVLALPVSLPLSLAWRPADLGAVAPAAWASLAYLGAMSMYLGFSPGTPAWRSAAWRG